MLSLKLLDSKISISSASRVWLPGHGGTNSVLGPPGSDGLVLVARYGELYSQARLDTLDALDQIKELSDAVELKNKLVFSAVVVSQ